MTRPLTTDAVLLETMLESERNNATLVIPPPPEKPERVREVRVPVLVDFPVWWVAAVCLVAGFVLGWAYPLLTCH